ncbi:hypothetical protein PP1Y_Mpl511 (plasmid) [Novosphingobium sp. PP1Y]|nr:hypothetical protein PP1Y_Mpl232 [Novosphingobium sp. PP1Y]CCA90049.1 hypothetical protein PP1Y_Mpl511 [Novosphingobium sp. PP1Y]
MDHGKEVFGQLVVSGGHPAEVFQLGEESFDQVALAVEPCAEIWFRPSVCLRRDIGKRSLLAECRPDMICIICFVGQHACSGGYVIEQVIGSFPVMALAGGQA